MADNANGHFWLRWTLIAGLTALSRWAVALPAAEEPAGDGGSVEAAATGRVVAPRLTKFVEADYPAAALEQGLTAVVRLRVTLDASGQVVDVAVVAPVGHGFDEAALAAVRQFEFAPASVGGEPVAVEIEYVYHFVLQPAAAESAPASQPTPLFGLHGRVLEKGTRIPLAAAEVHIVELDRTLETDDRGRFETRVPVGRYRLKISALEHDSAETGVTISGLYLTNIDIYLPSQADERFRTVVREKRDDRAQEPVIQLSAEEVRRIPGTFGDPVRVLQTLPGVARPRTMEGDIVVRGSEPGNTPVYLGGFAVPFLFHFGILESVVDPAFIESIDFFPGGVPLRYGNAAQGVVDVRTSEGKAERMSAQADLGATHSAGAITVPLLDDQLRLDFGGRYSYLGLSLPLLFAPISMLASEGELVMSVLPEFWDYNVRVSGGPRRLRGYVNLYGAHDGITIDAALVRQTIDNLLQMRGRSATDVAMHLTIYDQTFHHLVGGVKSRLDNGMEIDAALLLGTRTGFNVLSQSLGMAGALMRRTTQVASARLDWRIPLAPFAGLRVGGELEGRDERIEPWQDIPVLGELLPSAHEQPWGGGLFYAVESNPWRGGRITAGGRLQADRQHDTDFVRIDPRLVVEQDAAYGLTARIVFARQSQLPDFVRSSSALGAEALPLTTADQAMGGLSLELPWELEASIAGYTSLIEGLALQEPGWRIEETSDDQGNAVSSLQPYMRYLPAKGKAYGLELSLRRRPKGRFFGWISYSVSRSWRSTQANPSFVGDYDQPHHLIAVAAYKVGWGVEISARFRLASGNPFTPMLGAFDADSREYQEVRGPINSARDPIYHQLDVRLDKTFTFDWFKIGAYVDVYNAYMAQNPLPISEMHIYSYDHFDVSGIGSLPIIPFFGLHGEL
ncbi:MAG: TonB family protein [Deltaproteobacteria bacterium]|nr:TonB family protein [Deltaproteobacteria bacterium]